jgi:hypothetical protein
MKQLTRSQRVAIATLPIFPAAWLLLFARPGGEGPWRHVLPTVAIALMAVACVLAIAAVVKKP